ncbi:MAG: CRISPR-associated protein Cas5 [Chloroflexi bacterium]|nr:CRISPR-associated protein Cas5 [Chloroflexota bacterium]
MAGVKAPLRALKIVAQGLTTSFRYPYFMMGVQPTYEMPPPATLYGHVASALGEWFDPRDVRFAVRFTYRAKQHDVETTHLLSPAGGRLPHRREYRKVLAGKPNPFKREILFFPRLVLYLNRPEWLEAFRHPRHPVVLGRSQDLFTYLQVSVVALHPVQDAYLEHTLLPYEYGRYTAAGHAVLMPRFIDYRRGRFPVFERYLILHRRVFTRDFLRWPQDPGPQIWADPTEPQVRRTPLGIVWLAWDGAHDPNIHSNPVSTGQSPLSGG